MPQRFITLKSRAKINLYLDVVNKRDDGYHDISTILTPLSLHDSITLKKDDAITVSCDKSAVPTDNTNLAFIAAKLFFDEGGIKSGVHIDIQKNIPVAAGLGGGSSNAATTLIGLNKLFDSPLPKEKLIKIAEKIGADVPFFIESKSVYAEGIGNIFVYYPTLPTLYFILINPGFSVSAKFAYDNLKLPKEHKNNIGKEVLDSLNTSVDVALILKNSLEEPVINKYPILLDIKAELIKQQGCMGALMSGSGPTVFGLYEDARSASLAMQKIKSAMPDFWVHLTSNKLF